MKKLFLYGFVWLICAFACNTKEIKVAEPYKGPMLVGHNIYTNYSDSGKVKMRMWAPEQQELENGNRIFPKGVKIDFYGKNEKVSSVLTAKFATFDKTTGIYTVRNNVVIQSEEEGKKLNTEELKWMPKLHKVKIEKQHQVRIQTKTEVLTGYGLDANEDFKSYKLTKVTAILSVKNP